MLINTEYFKVKPSEIPKLPPELSYESFEWWKEQKRRCIEGYWVGGKFMPGRMYFYINFWTIQLNDKNNPKKRIFTKPELWDIHWEISEGLMIARGFIGFEKDPDTIKALKIQKEGDINKLRDYLDTLKNPLDIFSEPYKTNLGKPVYLKDNKDFMIMGSRSGGKSFYIGGAEIGHSFLFDNATEYPISVEESSVTVVGAEDTKFSGELLKKCKIGLDNLPGSYIINGEYYPSVFSKQYTGTFGNTVGKISAEYQTKEGGNWITKGTRSSILHVSFRDNPFAAAGTSTHNIYIEECGLCSNLLQIKEATEDCVMRAGVKFGTRIYLGTGGQMESGTIPSSMMFTDPERNDLVAYNDAYEHKGKIGYFIPAYKALQFFKDKDGNTLPEASNEIDRIREDLRKKSKSSAALDAEKQNKPIVPSEMFLSRTGNIFPTADLQKHVANLIVDTNYLDSIDVGEFIFNDEGLPQLTELSKDRYISRFPHNPKEDDIRGAWAIFEHPYKNSDGKVPDGLYISGTDPYDHNESGTMSLGSTFIYKKIISAGKTMELPVAEYTGRHEKGSNSHYEQIRRGLLYYNARNMHENANIGLYKYFEFKNYSYLLMDVPEYNKEAWGKQPNRQKGMHFGVAQIVHGENLIKDWLEEEISPGILQLTKIRSIPLLQELIYYNRKDNFDRVRAFMCVLYARQETMKRVIREEPKKVEDDWFNRTWNNAINKQSIFPTKDIKLLGR